jgi:serine protease Do
MENQYNYYTSDQNMNTENYSTGGNQDQGPKKKHGKGASRWAKVVCTGLVFGVVASAAFQTSNIVAGKVLGTTQTTNKTAKTTTTANSAKLTTSSNSSSGTANVTEVAKNAMPSIVSITNMSVQEVQNFFGGTQKQKSESAGSGIIVGQNDSELLIVTNNHVVEGSSTLTVTFIDEESVEADIKGTDSDKDLAVVAVPLSKIKDSTMNKIAVATLGDSDKTQVGDQVIAIGNALGYGQSVTTGIVSAKERTMDSYDGKLLQTDAAINPGNSGGALLNANGEVIGINSAKIATETVEGIGYAIPVSDVSDLITNLMNQKTKTKVAESERGYIGIKGVDVTSDSAQMYNMPTGVYVSEVISGGGAEKAGITKGAVITGIEGTTVDGMDALQEQLQYYKAGEKVKITVQTQSKNGEYEKKDGEVTLGKQSE